MKKIGKFILSALCVVSIGGGTAAFSACGASAEGEITISGSTSVAPLMRVLAGAYEDAHDGVIINISEGGSSVGISDAMSGKSDIGMVSRILTDDETSGENALVSLKIADDGIALIVNKNCAVSDVTTEEVKALYTEGTPIQDTVLAGISRGTGSGTRSAFNELIGIEDADLYSGQGFEEMDQTNTVISSIVGNTAGNTVGYISMGSLSDNVKALKFNGVEATTANVSNASYALSRPFNIAYKSDGLSDVAQDFIDFILSDEGQAIVIAQGYISV